MRGMRRWSLLLALLLAFGLAMAACGGDDDEGGDNGDAAADTGGSGEEATDEPIVIGAAVDLTGQMAPFDGPAVTAAEIQVDKINEAGGVDGRQLELRVVDHQLDPERTRSEEHTSELHSPCNLVCRLLLEKKNKPTNNINR